MCEHIKPEKFAASCCESMSQLLAVEQNPGSSLEAFTCFAAFFGYCQSVLSPVLSLQKYVCKAFFCKCSQWKYLQFRFLHLLP